MALEDVRRYRHGGLAARLYEQNPALAIPALDKLYEDLKEGVSDVIVERFEGFRTASYTNEESIKKTALIYASKYEEAKDDVDIGKFFDYFVNGFGDLSDEARAHKDQIRRKIDHHADLELGVLEASIDAPKSMKTLKRAGLSDFSDDEIEQAKTDAKEYKKTGDILKQIEEYYFNILAKQALPSEEEQTAKFLERLAE